MLSIKIQQVFLNAFPPPLLLILLLLFIFLSDWKASAAPVLEQIATSEHNPNFSFDPNTLEDQEHVRRLAMFNYSTETFDINLLPMAAEGTEALGSMGVDTPPAVLSQQARPMSEFFRQLFAQVTNPPIDPIREAPIMSLRCPIGPEKNLLETIPQHAERLTLDHPILSLEEMAAIKHVPYRGWTSKTIDITFDVPSHKSQARVASSLEGTNDIEDGKALVAALDHICNEASRLIDEENVPILVLSDRLAGLNRLPIPSLLAVGAVHQHLVRTRQRSLVSTILTFISSESIKNIYIKDIPPLTFSFCEIWYFCMFRLD